MGRRKSSVAILVEEFKSRYRFLWSEKYGGLSMVRLSMTDRRRVTEIIGTLGLDEVLGRLGRYFSDGSRWLGDNAHPLKVFLAQVDQYRSKEHGKKKIAKAGRSFDDRWDV